MVAIFAKFCNMSESTYLYKTPAAWTATSVVLTCAHSTTTMKTSVSISVSSAPLVQQKLKTYSSEMLSINTFTILNLHKGHYLSASGLLDPGGGVRAGGGGAGGFRAARQALLRLGAGAEHLQPLQRGPRADQPRAARVLRARPHPRARRSLRQEDRQRAPGNTHNFY